MNTPRLFFRMNSGDEFCYNLKHFKDVIKKEFDDLPLRVPHSIVLTEAKISFGDGTFYCKEYGEVGTVYDSECGSECKDYDPRNKKSGRCRHSSSCYEPGYRYYNLRIDVDGKIKLTEIV